MFLKIWPQESTRNAHFCSKSLSFFLMLTLVTGSSVSLPAQDNSGQSSNTQAPNAQQNPNQQEVPPEAGGPNSDTGPYAIPKKGESEPPPPAPERPKKTPGMPDYSIRVDVPLVTVPVMVTTKNGQFISTLKKENFRVFEDGAQQTIADFKVEDAPITAVMLIEVSSTWWGFGLQTIQASYIFSETP